MEQRDFQERNFPEYLIQKYELAIERCTGMGTRCRILPMHTCICITGAGKGVGK